MQKCPAVKIARQEAATWTRLGVLDRPLIGVDGTEPAFEACRQVGRLAKPDTAIDVVAVVHLHEAIGAELEASSAADRLLREAELALDTAATILGQRAQKRFVHGYVTAALLEEVQRRHTTLLGLGSHGHRRMTEILFGGVAGELLQKAPCSVLITRPASEPSSFPRSIVVGMDGSPNSETALIAAHHLAARFGSTIRVITALKGKHTDLAHIQLQAPSAEALDEHPVEALVGASHDADLLVVGSRGLQGLRALGSVSERVAHQASCSVLIVRVPAPVRRSTFDDEEWRLVRQAPTYAGLIVGSAQSGGSFWEVLSIARTYADVRAAQGHNLLLDDIIAEKPLAEHTRFRREYALAQIRGAIELLKMKAQPADVDAFAQFVLDVAERVAGAHPRKDEPVSAAEEHALSEVRTALGLNPEADDD